MLLFCCILFWRWPSVRTTKPCQTPPSKPYADNCQSPVARWTGPRSSVIRLEKRCRMLRTQRIIGLQLLQYCLFKRNKHTVLDVLQWDSSWYALRRDKFIVNSCWGSQTSSSMLMVFFFNWRSGGFPAVFVNPHCFILTHSLQTTWLLCSDWFVMHFLLELPIPL